MRIVHVMTHLRLGAGRAIVDLCVEQKRCGHDVIVVLSEDAEGAWCSHPGLIAELGASRIAVTQVGDLFHRDPRALGEASGALKARIGNWHGTVAHAHTAMTAAVARWAGATKVVATCHGWSLERSPSYDLQDALAFSMVDTVISPSGPWADRVRELPGAPPVVVIPNGFDLHRYPRLARPRPDQGRPLRIVCVGELTGRKGQDILLEAMPAVWCAVPACELELIGDGDAGLTLRGRAAALDPTGMRVRFAGHIDNPYPRLAEADVFCLPSRSDNQPVAIIEAMLAGVPVIASDVGGVAELLNGGGLLVAPGAVDDLARALVGFLTRASPEPLGSALEARARQTFAVTVSARLVQDVYASAAATGPAD